MSAGSIALQGEMGSVAAVGHRLANLAGLNAAMGQLRTGIGQVRDSGDSKALTALVTACTPIETLAQQIATARHHVGVVLVSYANEVTALQDEVRRLRLQFEEATAQVAFTKRSLAEQTSETLLVPMTPDDRMRMRMLEDRVDEQEAHLRRIERALQACDDARRAADAACVHKISGHSDAFAAVTMHAVTGVPKVTLASLFTVATANTQTAATDAALQALLSGALTPEEVAKTWAALLADPNFDAEEALEKYSFEFAKLDGLPFGAMSHAAEYALGFALDKDHPGNLTIAYERMGFQPGELSMEDFKKDLEAIQKSFIKAGKLVQGPDVVQLVSFGRHDGVVTAGISLGDLDTASHVGVFVSGMLSNVRQLSDTLDAFKTIRGGDTNMAMVTWIGYRSPSMSEEAFQNRADSGGVAFASFLDGIAAQRTGQPPLERLVALGHSYGTNVVSEALKITQAHVQAFVTIGSAGLQYGTTAEQLGDSDLEIYATHAEGDGAAKFGRNFHFRFGIEDGGGIYESRVNPMDLEGAVTFSSEADGGGKQVTMHNLKNPIELPGFLSWMGDLDGIPAKEEIGYMDYRSSTVNGVKKIMRGEDPR